MIEYKRFRTERGVVHISSPETSPRYMCGTLKGVRDVPYRYRLGTCERCAHAHLSAKDPTTSRQRYAKPYLWGSK